MTKQGDVERIWWLIFTKQNILWIVALQGLVCVMDRGVVSNSKYEEQSHLIVKDEGQKIGLQIIKFFNTDVSEDV